MSENLAEEVKISKTVNLFTASNVNNSTSGLMVQTIEHRRPLEHWSLQKMHIKKGKHAGNVYISGLALFFFFLQLTIILFLYAFFSKLLV